MSLYIVDIHGELEGDYEEIRKYEEGEWVDHADEIEKTANRHFFECPHCGQSATYFIGGTEDWWCAEAPNYCPHCGDPMKGDTITVEVKHQVLTKDDIKDVDLNVTAEEVAQAEKIIKSERDIKEDPAMLKRAAFDKAMEETSQKDIRMTAEEASKQFERIFNKPDNVNNPKHYAGSCSIECIDAMQMAYGKYVVHNFCICNAFKYLWRHKNKNGMEDLNKAEWYINKAEELSEYHDPIMQDLRAVLDKYREGFK